MFADYSAINYRMKFQQISLQIKIFFGYGVIILVIGYMFFVLFHERNRMNTIEQKEQELHHVRKEINTIHRYITGLATSAESVACWQEEDCVAYHEKREEVDHLLLKLTETRLEQTELVQIDTLRNLLREKENQLMQIAELYIRKDRVDSLIMRRLSVIAYQVINPRTVTRRKKGIAGLLGKKETVTVVPVTSYLHRENRQLFDLQEEYGDLLDFYTDSLEWHNKKLNHELMALITRLDSLSETEFYNKISKMTEIREESLSNIYMAMFLALFLILVSHVVIQRDIRRRAKERTELERLLNQNRELLTMRDKIILTVSHDIRSPLNIISGHAELAKGCWNKEKLDYHLAKVSRSCCHILHLVNNLLDIYRMNGSKESRHDVPFHLDVFFDRIQDTYRQKANNKGLLFIVENTGLDVNVLGDMDRLEQILDNLLGNAVKFTDSGHIHLVALYKEGNLSLIVSDTGVGMDESIQKHLFVPFERGSQHMNPDGFGLGLAITKGLVGLLEGTISVRSVYGKGSTFEVVLPLPIMEGGVDTDDNLVPVSLHLPQNVLVIDDDRMQLEVIYEFLERGGVSCRICQTAKEVVAALRDSQFDMVLTDIQMSGTNGFNLLKLLRMSCIGNSRTVPVLAMTARGDANPGTYQEAGFAGCIYKPFSKDQLLRFLSSIMLQVKGKEFSTIKFQPLLDDVVDKERILLSLLEESKKNITDLEKGLQSENLHSLRKTIHRMLPMWELLRMDNILERVHKMLYDDTTNFESVKIGTERIINYIRELIKDIDVEIRKMDNETENTDC